MSRNPVVEEKLYISKIFFHKHDQSPLDIKHELAYEALLVASLLEVLSGMITRDQLAEALNKNENYQMLINVIRSGFPGKRQDLFHTLREFLEVHDCQFSLKWYCLLGSTFSSSTEARYTNS